jgi:hypothetical protein
MAKRFVIPVLGRLRQEDLELDNSLCYIMMPCFKQKKKKAMKERRKKEKERMKKKERKEERKEGRKKQKERKSQEVTAANRFI